MPDAGAISAAGKRVVIIGGGDTGADCLGTAHRQGARSVHQFELLPRPPDTRADNNPWPQWPQIFRVSSRARRRRRAAVLGLDDASSSAMPTAACRGSRGVSVVPAQENGRMTFKPVPGSDFTLECELVLLAMGFTGPERSVVDQLGVKLTDRGTVWRDERG